MTKLTIQWDEARINSWPIERYGKEQMRPGLATTSSFFSPFRALFADKKIFIIGGTNGKGQTSRYLDALLRAQGKSTALWTSPHLFTVRERLVQNGKSISIEELGALYLQVSEDLRSLNFSYYEFLFACFCVWAQQLGNITDIILEVGLGGRLDTVNHFDGHLLAITSIGRDHTEILGNSYQQILAEKIAISRRHHPLVTSLELRYLRQQVQSYCQRHEIDWYDLFATNIITPQCTFEEKNRKMAMSMAFLATGASSLPKYDDHYWQQHIPVLPIGERMEELTIGRIHFIFIGTHNLAGLRELLRIRHIYGQVLVAFSLRPHWEWSGMVTLLTRTWKKWPVIFTTFDHPKAWPLAIAQGWGEWAQSQQENFSWSANWKSVIHEIIEQDQPQTILATGSNYFVGEVQKFLITNYDRIYLKGSQC